MPAVLSKRTKIVVPLSNDEVDRQAAITRRSWMTTLSDPTSIAKEITYEGAESICGLNSLPF